MSNTDKMSPDEYTHCPNQSQAACAIPLPARRSVLGEGMIIRRLLPHHGKRMIGAWCFFDHAGPVDVSEGSGVRVGPHPHTGLQTFSWMVDGEILHRDSLGFEQLLKQGQVNLMTAGRGISHSEESPAERSPTLQLAQLWIALPSEKRFIEPSFDHYPELPRIEKNGAVITLLVGDWLNEVSPVVVHSPLLGADITTAASSHLELPLNPAFEHGIAVLTGSAIVDEHPLHPGTLLYLGKHRERLSITIPEASQILLIGGEPFAEDVMLYWNFLARDEKEVREFIHLWETSSHFGTVKGYDGPALTAPRLAPNTHLK